MSAGTEELPAANPERVRALIKEHAGPVLVDGKPMPADEFARRYNEADPAVMTKIVLLLEAIPTEGPLHEEVTALLREPMDAMTFALQRLFLRQDASPHLLKQIYALHLGCPTGVLLKQVDHPELGAFYRQELASCPGVATGIARHVERIFQARTGPHVRGGGEAAERVVRSWLTHPELVSVVQAGLAKVDEVKWAEVEPLRRLAAEQKA